MSVQALRASESGYRFPEGDFFSGLDLTSSSVYGYSGFTISPWSAPDQPGFRLRFSGGAGRYSYDGQYMAGSTAIPLKFSGQTTSADLMPGYGFETEGWVVKLYGGIVWTSHILSPSDPGNRVQGSQVGAKVQAEIWKDIGRSGWFAADLGYSTVFEEYRAQAKAGYDILPFLSVGLEGALFGNASHDAGRAGTTGLLRTDFGDLSLSGGVSGNYRENMSPYFSLSLYRRF